MEDITKKLLKQLKNIYGTEYKPHSLSKTNTHFFKKIHSICVKGIQSWVNNQHEIKQSTIKIVQGTHIKKGSAYVNIPSSIQRILENTMVYEQSFEFELKGKHHTIVLAYPINKNSNKFTILKYFFESIFKIYVWLYIAYEFSPKECSVNMQIYLYFSDHLKQLSTIPGKPLDQIHVNTALTTSCSHTTDIHIFRQEEWFKVFIHETFHNLGLDFSSMDDSKSNAYILELFPIQSNNGIRLYETYCETWAEILHTFFISVYSVNR
jgi:hypothetical protein